MDISTAFTTFNQIKDILQVLQNIEKQYDNLEMKAQILELKDAFLILKNEYLDAKEIINNQKEKISELEAKIQNLTTGEVCKKCKKGNMEFIDEYGTGAMKTKGYVEETYICNNKECHHNQTKQRKIRY